jgi:CRISPR-associated endonuclease/helicase Cas3
LPEVQVVWRADLDAVKPQQWAEIVSLCPPVSIEAMAVPLREFRAWLTKSSDDGASASDIEGVGTEAGREEVGQLRCPVLRWRGDESYLIESANGVRPGDTLILAMASGGWEELGHVPEEAGIDVAERARYILRRGWVLRLHPDLLERWPESAARDRLIQLAGQPAVEKGDVLRALEEYKEAAPQWLVEMLNDLPKGLELDGYPTDDGAAAGWVLSGQFAEADSGGDESSAAPPVFLDRHLEDVLRAVSEAASALLLNEDIRTSLLRAAQFHDWGKADPRFQALLRGGDPMAAQFAPRLLAKGSQSRLSKQVRGAQWARSGLPDGFRHELVSLLFAQAHSDTPEADLTLHLIASHHGRCRPFAPVVENPGGDLAYSGRRITSAQRIVGAPHRLENGAADRFWKLTRRYGWWGLAYLESLLRLGDWKASKEEANAKESKP